MSEYIYLDRIRIRIYSYRAFFTEYIYEYFQFLRIKYQGGNLNIAHNMLPDVDAFDKVVKLVHAGMDAASEKATK